MTKLTNVLASLCLPEMPKLNGNNDHMWATKSELLLTQLDFGYALHLKWLLKDLKGVNKKDNKTCCGLLLCYMSDLMYRIYSKMQSTKKIWEAPMSKYDSNDIRIKKYACRAAVGGCPLKWLIINLFLDKYMCTKIYMLKFWLWLWTFVISFDPIAY